MLSTLSAFSMRAQAQSPSPQQLQTLEDLANQVKAALQQGDLEKANHLSSDLMLGIFKQRKALEPNPKDAFAKLEQAVPPSGLERFCALSNLAKAAFKAGELNRAEDYARELLAMAPDYPKNWNYGNAIFYSNMVMGRVALKRDGDIPLAKTYLLASAKTPGSPTLDTFGPNMSLAKDLLSHGERDTVLDFFTLCRSFWKSGSAKLDDWTAVVRGGAMPDFGANLEY